MMYELRLLKLSSGEVLQMRVQASSPELASTQVQDPQLRVLSVRASTNLPGLAMRRQAQPDYPLFCRELRTLLVAGMGVVEAIDTLSDFDLRGQKNTATQESSLARRLRNSLQQGQALSAALAQMPDVPAVLLACVRSVEHTSNLQDALDDYLRYHDMLAQLRSKIVSAAIYPAIVTALGLGVTVFLLAVVMPQFAKMYGQLRGQAQGLTFVVITLSDGLAEHRLLFMGTVGALLAGLAMWMASGQAWASVSRWLWHLGWARTQLMDYQLALFYQSLHLMTKGGYALVTALQISRTASISALLQTQVAACQQDIEQGRSVSASLHRAGLANEVDRRLLAAGEDNGEFSQVAQTIAQLHRSRFELMVERLTRIVEPVLLMLVALMVGSLVVVMYMPVFEMGALTR